METSIVKSHSFEVAKNDIQKFANNIPQTPSLTKVSTTGTSAWGRFFGTNHNVTGTELNTLIGEVQKSFSTNYQTTKLIVQEFTKIYNAFDALDRDYIQWILKSLDGAVKASNEAKNAQSDVNRTINGLRETIEVLKAFKNKTNSDIDALKREISNLQNSSNRGYVSYNSEPSYNNADIQSLRNRLDSIDFSKINGDISSLQAFRNRIDNLAHISDIDKIWSDLRDCISDLEKLKRKFDETERKFGDRLAETQKYIDKLKTYVHIEDIDKLWDYSHKTNEEHESKIAVANKYIDELNKYKGVLMSYVHLPQIDSIWDDLEKSKYSILVLLEFKKRLEGYTYLSQIDELWDFAHQNIQNHSDHLKSIDAKIVDIEETIQKEKKKTKKKMIAAFTIAGAGLTFSIVQFALILAKIL